MLMMRAKKGFIKEMTKRNLAFASRRQRVTYNVQDHLPLDCRINIIHDLRVALLF